ncbi:hypothetical protein HYV80_05130 [Candidatus Woesearchaeota archaeon]|nr:hypothetical protein [Candidatus Woesearchaeota archaeon]
MRHGIGNHIFYPHTPVSERVHPRVRDFHKQPNTSDNPARELERLMGNTLTDSYGGPRLSQEGNQIYAKLIRQGSGKSVQNIPENTKSGGHKAVVRFYSPFGRAVAAGTLAAILSGCASAGLPKSSQYADGSNVKADATYSQNKEVWDTLTNERSIDDAFREGKYAEGVARVPFDFARKTIIRGVTAPKTFLYDIPRQTISDIDERVANSTTPEDKLGHKIGSIIFFPALYVLKMIENMAKYVAKHPIEAVIHGTGYGVIGATVTKGNSSSSSSSGSGGIAPPPL